ncbi:MAG: orotate phosphoribosyltransferase [Chloroflexi bacterium]|nr:orotate phosphoribosyltransferase [Chloroflexota bacterium]
MGKVSREKIRELVERLSVRRGDFTLASGQKSSYYFDGKMATTDPEAATLIAPEIFEELRGTGATAVGGMTIGGALMGPPVSVISNLAGKPLPAFVVRDERKEHGTQKVIEGQLPREKGAKVAIIEDVITQGGSVLRAIERVEEAGCTVVKVIVLVDRHQGGSDKVRDRGYDFLALLHADSNGNLSVDGPGAESPNASRSPSPCPLPQRERD